jgi:hypothetical protein
VRRAIVGTVLRLSLTLGFEGSALGSNVRTILLGGAQRFF